MARDNNNESYSVFTAFRTLIDQADNFHNILNSKHKICQTDAFDNWISTSSSSSLAITPWDV